MIDQLIKFVICLKLGRFTLGREKEHEKGTRDGKGCEVQWGELAKLVIEGWEERQRGREIKD